MLTRENADWFISKAHNARNWLEMSQVLIGIINAITEPETTPGQPGNLIEKFIKKLHEAGSPYRDNCCSEVRKLLPGLLIEIAEELQRRSPYEARFSWEYFVWKECCDEIERMIKEAK